MYEIDFLPVGKGGRHGDAIALRFTRPDTGGLAHVIIDAGFEEHGKALVDHVHRYYNTTSIDIAIVTHPDGDHIGGMGHVIRDLDVTTLCIHRLRERGGDGLPAADAVDELIALAEENGTRVHEPFAGTWAFDGALMILGPTEDWYEELVAEQQVEARERAAAAARTPSAMLEAARRLGQQFLAALPIEVPFDDAGGTNPRNNSSAITLVNVAGHESSFPLMPACLRSSAPGIGPSGWVRRSDPTALTCRTTAAGTTRHPQSSIASSAQPARHRRAKHS